MPGLNETNIPSWETLRLNTTRSLMLRIFSHLKSKERRVVPRLIPGVIRSGLRMGRPRMKTRMKLKTLDTFDNSQRPVLSLGVSQHLHKIANL